MYEWAPYFGKLPHAKYYNVNSERQAAETAKQLHDEGGIPRRACYNHVLQESRSYFEILYYPLLPLPNIDLQRNRIGVLGLVYALFGGGGGRGRVV